MPDIQQRSSTSLLGPLAYLRFYFIGGLPRVLFSFAKSRISYKKPPLLRGVPSDGILGWTHTLVAPSSSSFAHAAFIAAASEALESAQSASRPTCRPQNTLHIGVTGLTGYCIRAMPDTIASARTLKVGPPAAPILSLSRQWHLDLPGHAQPAH